MKTNRTLAAKLPWNRCPQHLPNAWLSGIFRALRLVFDTAALLLNVVAAKAATLLLLCPASAHAQAGVPLWTNIYPSGSASAIAVDSRGNVFVTGTDVSDYVTLGYSNSGVTLWTNRYDGPANSGDLASAIAVDSDGNVFVTGSSYGAVDNKDFATIKYSNAGVPLWTNRYDGPGNWADSPIAIATDKDGNVFVTGLSGNGSSQGNGSLDYATIKYSSAGDLLWINRYDGPESNEDWPTAMTVDSNGNVFVTGYSCNSSRDNRDYATVAYSSTGALLWENRYNGTGNAFDNPFGAVVDNDGNVLVTGVSVGDSSGPDYATIKYARTGVPLWTKRYNGPANDNDVGRDVTVDSSGNVFVTGDDSAGIATIKYSSAGGTLWTRRYAQASTQGLVGAIAVDDSGNVFVIGNTSSDSVTIAYSNAGTPLWTNRFYGQLSQLALDSAGNVFVTGNGANSNFVTIKYSSSVPPPRLDFQKLNNALVLSWTNAGFTLQTAPVATGPFTNLPAATTPYTNPIAVPQQFFRLKGD